MTGIVNFAVSNPALFTHSQEIKQNARDRRVHSSLVSSLKCGTSHCAQVNVINIHYKKADLSKASGLPSLSNGCF